MPVITTCSSCSSKLKFPDQYAGRKVRCPKCEGVIALPAGEKVPAGAAESKKSIPSEKKKSAPATKTDPKKAITTAAGNASSKSAPSKAKGNATSADDFDVGPALEPEPRRSRRNDHDDDYDDYEDEHEDRPSRSRGRARDDRYSDRPRRHRDDYDDDYEDDYEDYGDEDSRSSRRGRAPELRSALLSEEMEDKVAAELSRSEKVIWIGQPSVRLVLIRTLIATLIGLVFAGGGFAFSLLEWGGKLSGMGSGFGALLVLAGVVFLLGGLGIPLLWGRFRAVRTCYVLTDKRAIVWEKTWFGGTNLRTYDARELRKLKRQDTWWMNNAGDIVFEEERETVHTGKGRTRTRIRKYGFMSVELSREIEKLIRDTLVSPDRAPRPIPVRDPEELLEHEAVSGKTFAIVGGGIGALVIGLGLAIFFTVQGARDETEDALAGTGNDGGGANPFGGNNNDGGGRPRQGGRPRPGRVTINNTPQALAALKGNNEQEQRAALDYLARTPAQPQFQKQIASALSPYFQSQNVWMKSSAFRAAERWATTDNVPALIAVLDPNGSGHSGEQKQAIKILGRLKDPRGVEPVARYLHNFFVRGEAEGATVQLGKLAQPLLLSWMHDPERKHHEPARKMLPRIGTSDKELFAQTEKDLTSPDMDRQKLAMDWVRRQRVTDENRAAIAKGLEKLLDHRDNNTRYTALVELEKWGGPDNTKAVSAIIDDRENRIADAAMKFLVAHGNAEAEPQVIELLNKADLKRLRQAERYGVQFLGKNGSKKCGPALVRYLETYFARDAMNSLELLGPEVGEEAVIQEICHPNANVRRCVQDLLKNYKTEKGKTLSPVVKNLEADDLDRRRYAAEWLATFTEPVEERHKEISRALEPLLTSTNPQLRQAGMNAAAIWATEVNLTSLIKWAAISGPSERALAYPAMRALGRMKDPRAVPVLVKQAGDFWMNSVAKEVLQTMPMIAETELLKSRAANDKELEHFCNVLKLVGGARSLPVLEQIFKTTRNGGLKRAADAAYKAIELRLQQQKPGAGNP